MTEEKPHRMTVFLKQVTGDRCHRGSRRLVVGHRGRKGSHRSGGDAAEALTNLDEAVEVTADARDDDTPAPKPDAPWFEFS